MTCSPCKGCPDRHPACHDTCDRYGAWKARKDAGRLKKQADKDAVAALIEGNVQRREAYRAHARNRLKSLK
jgi:hypothetical protein